MEICELGGFGCESVKHDPQVSLLALLHAMKALQGGSVKRAYFKAGADVRYASGRERFENRGDSVAFVYDANSPHVRIDSLATAGHFSEFSPAYQVFRFSSSTMVLKIDGMDKNTGEEYSVRIRFRERS